MVYCRKEYGKPPEPTINVRFGGALSVAWRTRTTEIGRLRFPRKRTSRIQKSADPHRLCRLARCAKETLEIRSSGTAV